MRSILIQAIEFPNTVSNQIRLMVTVRNVNDQPMLTSSTQRARVVTLTDYLPEESNNPGFNVSYLLRPDDVSCALHPQQTVPIVA